MFIALQSLVTMHCNLLTDIRIATETGHSGIEINGPKLKRYLAQGYTIESLLPLLKDLPPVGLTYVQDIERKDPRQRAALLEECEVLCSLAEKLGCPMVQLLTGPLDPNGSYKGLGDIPWPELREQTAKNLRSIAQIGRAHQVRFFLEALTWTPLHKLSQVLEVIDTAGENNVGLVVDFWHLWDSGTTADEIAKLQKDVIYCVHFCDSLEKWGERGTHRAARPGCVDRRGSDSPKGMGRRSQKHRVRWLLVLRTAKSEVLGTRSMEDGSRSEGFLGVLAPLGVVNVISIGG